MGSNDNIIDALAQDSSAEKLSYVGKSCYKILQTKHAWHHHKLWNVTSGKTIGSLHQTPKSDIFSSTDAPVDGHDDWFPEKMFEIMSRTKVWCDVMSLGPPDGIFLTKFNEALKTIAENAKDSEKPVIVRFLMGNIVGMPTNCNSLVKELTKGLPDDANIQLWVGAWRKGASWNHAKLIAADGRYLHTGGHNLWDAHYLKNNPVHDLSIEMEGRVAHDGHLYANAQWQFIEKKQSTCGGQIVDHLPDSVPLIWKTRVTVSEYPPIKGMCIKRHDLLLKLVLIVNEYLFINNISFFSEFSLSLSVPKLPNFLLCIRRVWSQLMTSQKAQYQYFR